MKLGAPPLNRTRESPVGYGTVEVAPNEHSEPLHELLVGRHQGFLLDLFAPAAERNP